MSPEQRGGAVFDKLALCVRPEYPSAASTLRQIRLVEVLKVLPFGADGMRLPVLDSTLVGYLTIQHDCFDLHDFGLRW